MRVVAAVFCLAVATSAAAAELAVKLTLPKTESLFGLAVPLQAEIVNGDEPVVVAGSAAIEAVRAGEAPRLLEIGTRRTAEIDFGKDTAGEGLRLRPREKMAFSIPVDSIRKPTWASDPVLLSRPAEWTLRLVLYSTDGEVIARSTAATLTILEPQGSDREIWDALVGGDLKRAGTLSLQHRESPYLPYLAPRIPQRDIRSRIAFLRAVLDEHPGSPMAPRLQVTIADWYETLSREEFAAGDMEEAVRLAELSRREYRNVVGDVAMKRLAARRVLTVPDRAYYERSRVPALTPHN